MPAVTSYTKLLTTEQAEKLRVLIGDRGFRLDEKPHCLYAGAGDKVNVAVYAKGPKVVVQGKGTEDFVKFTLEPEVLGAAEMGYEEVLHPDRFTPHIGVDESGKGDFFGPLVIAGVYANLEVARALQEIGVMDSKRISGDTRIETLAGQLRTIPGLAHEVIVIGPERYNALYMKFGNLNKLLAWGHAKVIEILLERVPDCPRALSDQFANPHVLKNALQARGKTIVLEQRTKAESDPAVAAASILARQGFVHWLKENGARLGVDLPKGASAGVKAAAAAIRARHGPAMLEKVAKMHFRTARELDA